MICRFLYFSHFQTEYFRPITNNSDFRRSSRTRHFVLHRSVCILLLDKVTDLGFYPNLILILTSNVSRDALHELDESVLRDGRIDKAYHMTTNKVL